MADGQHCFISYSAADGLEFATKLADELQGRHPNIHVWFDKREMDASNVDWDDQLANAIKGCKCLVFVMTVDSTAKGSTCKEEWTWALKYKKPVICLLNDKKAEVPFRLNNRQYIDVSTDFDSGIALLRTAIKRLDEPEGILEELDRRLSQAKRDLQRTPHEEEKPRIQAEIEELNKQIEAQQKVVANPKKAEEQTQKNIEAGLERERKPEKPTAAQTNTKFINPPPGIAPNYFQDRFIETKQVVEFFKDNSQRLMTIVGRGGVGKTAMVCRLLKGIESGILPDDLGEMKADGIVYLSEAGSHRVNFTNIFYDLCKLLPNNVAQELDTVYKNPQASTESKMRALLDRFTEGKFILLLDNIEPLINVETFNIGDAELDESLCAFLHGAHSTVKIIATTRIAPRGLNLCEPGRQRIYHLEEGLPSPYAEKMLRELDIDGTLGLRDAKEEDLTRARIKTRGFPKGLEAFKQILASDRYTTLEELLAMPTPENVVEALVGEAFNRLDTNAQKVMQALAVYNRPVTPAAVDYLLAPHIPAIDSAPILQRLANMHFARKESGRFYLHPVDREFAYNLLPEGSSDDTSIEKGGIQLFNKLLGLLQKYPDLLNNQETFNQAVKNENANIVIGSVMAFQKLDASLVKQMQQEGIFQDENFLAELDKSFHIPPIWSRYALTNRAADYFAKARKPRMEWRKLDDLSAQLAEFDLRCAAGDYDTAASVLLEIDMEYLFLWGHYRLMIQMHGKLQGNLRDKVLSMHCFNSVGAAYAYVGEIKCGIIFQEQGLQVARELSNHSAQAGFLGNLGNRYADLGDAHKTIELYEQALFIAREISDRSLEETHLGGIGNHYVGQGEAHKAIKYFQQALVIAREIGNHWHEGNHFGSLGNAYSAIGDASKAIECYEQALIIARETGDKHGEGNWSGNLGLAYLELDESNKALGLFGDAVEILSEINSRGLQSVHTENYGHALVELGRLDEAIEYFKKAFQIADEIGYLQIQNYGRYALASTYLLQNKLAQACATIEAALQYDVPINNHYASALHGIIALRQGDEVTARAAFVRAIGQADEILSKTAEYYSALDAKGLAVCGLILAGRGDPSMPTETNDGKTAPPDKVTVSAGRAPYGHDIAPTVDDAIETFRKAREIAPHAGVVKSVLRLFDELVKCEGGEILKDVREVIAGS